MWIGLNGGAQVTIISVRILGSEFVVCNEHPIGSSGSVVFLGKSRCGFTLLRGNVWIVSILNGVF